jgi:hypothetical protein
MAEQVMPDPTLIMVPVTRLSRAKVEASPEYFEDHQAKVMLS